jgi:hypothetical protein
MGEFAEKQPVPGGPDAPAVKELSRPLFEAKGWMKFLGVLMIVYGALTACTIVGIIIAWLPIWLGILLFSAGSKVDAAFQGGNKADFLAGLGKLKTFFMICGIMAIIMMLVWGAALFALIASGELSGLTGM